MKVTRLWWRATILKCSLLPKCLKHTKNIEFDLMQFPVIVLLKYFHSYGHTVLVVWTIRTHRVVQVVYHWNFNSFIWRNVPSLTLFLLFFFPEKILMPSCWGNTAQYLVSLKAVIVSSCLFNVNKSRHIDSPLTLNSHWSRSIHDSLLMTLLTSLRRKKQRTQKTRRQTIGWNLEASITLFPRLLEDRKWF